MSDKPRPPFAAAPAAAFAGALDTLSQVDDRLDARGGRRSSLAPGRFGATHLVAVATSLLEREVPTGAGKMAAFQAFANALGAIASAMALHFPENIFWDLDYLAASLYHVALGPPAVASNLAEVTRLVIELHEFFGCQTSIRFRYVHDFLYGFDWARWVARDPEARGNIGPFDPVFLGAMKARGAELADLIARGDAKYIKLETGVARNPFGFSREPENERVLHEDLASRGMIPIEAWNPVAKPDWQRPFSRLREERASALGFGRRA